jgi:hypothetical protein
MVIYIRNICNFCHGNIFAGYNIITWLCYKNSHSFHFDGVTNELMELGMWNMVRM